MGTTTLSVEIDNFFSKKHFY